jgi:hypothetical protein
MSTSDIFAGYENSLLVVKNDDSDYFVPSFGVQTLSEMCPGESYAVFLNGGDDVDFMFPMGSGAALSVSDSDDNFDLDSYLEETRTDDIALTGESHLIALTTIGGEVEIGDQLRAYANDILVGSINIVSEHFNGEHPVDLIAVGSIDLSDYNGPILEGYSKGDEIELRLWNVKHDVELKVSTEYVSINGMDTNSDVYGNIIGMSVGTATVLNESAIPTQLSLTQNYPNPFNPSTTINYNVSTNGMVSLKVYDIMGRLVKTLVNDYKVSGNQSGYSVVWDGRDNKGQQVATGLYIYSLQTPDGNMTKKMVLMK